MGRCVVDSRRGIEMNCRMWIQLDSFLSVEPASRKECRMMTGFLELECTFIANDP